MKNILIVFILVLNSLFSFSQAKPDEAELEIKLEFEQLSKSSDDSLKLAICNRIQERFQELLLVPESFNYPFVHLKQMGKLTSPDQAFRIYNWNCVLSDGSYRYFALIQKRQKEGIQLITLHDNQTDTDMQHTFQNGNWPGALYYKIIPFESGRKQMYILLGWDGNTHQTNKKMIEILSFDKRGNALFGAPLIGWRGKILHRVVFEYAKQAQMNIQYNEKKNRIVFDHLSPSSSRYQNQFEYYGPDFSYDALEYRKGKWGLIENIDARNK